MKYALVFRMEGLDGKTHAYRPSVLNDTSPERIAGLKSLVLRVHGIKYERFMEIFRDEMEMQGLMVAPVEEEKDEAESTKG